MNIIGKILLGVLGFGGLILILGLLMAWPVQLLWNGCIVGTIEGIKPLASIWHAWGVLILCGLLFKSSKG